MTFSIELAMNRDAPEIIGIYRPIVESTPISFEARVPDEDEIRRRIASTLSAYPWLVCRDQSRIAGYAYAGGHRVRDAYRWSVETSVYVDSDYRRQGVGQALYVTLLGILTAQGYCSAYAGITLPNPASVALHESVGFEPVGVYRRVGYKLGKWHDVGWWQLALQPSTAEPKPARGIGEIEDSEWTELLASGLPRIRPRL
jgi:L-amino acid N-acyltransferase YncA